MNSNQCDIERVADEERLRGGVKFIEQIPRNDGGKPVRRQLLIRAVGSCQKTCHV